MKHGKSMDSPRRGTVVFRRDLTEWKWLLFLPWLVGLVVASDFDEMSLKEVETKLEEIDSELETLAHPTMRAGVGNIGWGSRGRREADRPEWVRVEFEEDVEIDRIVLVPVVWRDPDTGLEGDAFPVDFEVIVGRKGKDSGSVVASYDASDALLPRIAPLVIPVEPVSCAWVEIRAELLSQRSLDGLFAFQLAEVMAFSGGENVALHGNVRSSSLYGSRVGGSYSREALVDGTTPYVIDAADGEPSQSCVVFYITGDTPFLVFDLGETQEIDQIRLHAPDFSESVPQIRHADYGLPRAMLIDGANSPDFTDSVELVEYRRSTIYGSGPVIPLRFPPASCRYVRFTVTNGYGAPEAKEHHRCVGFTEIEILASGSNVARGVKPEVKGELNFVDGHLKNLTDGRNHFGNILPLREWMEQLARRHDLSLLRPVVDRELLNRYRHQGAKLTQLAWLAGLLAVGLVIAVLLGRMARMRQVTRIKKRFVADLHDEVGANLHAIAILSDIVRGRLKSGAGAEELLDEVRVISQETSEATRHCTSMVEAKGLCEDLEAELRRSASRMLRDTDHEFKVVGGRNLKLLAPKRRIDLLLFFKECLTNVMRHSHATRVEIEMKADGRHVSLQVDDNGDGTVGGISSSLKRRARLLRGKLNVVPRNGGGTSVSLELKSRKFGFIHG